MNKKQKAEFKKDDQVRYIGRGFLGFDKNNPVGKFEKYDGMHDCYILYNGNSVLVKKYDIEALK